MTDPEARWLLTVSNFCEEFDLSPTEARHELENDPDRLGQRIIRVRQYIRTKEAIDAADKPKSGLKPPTGALAGLARAIEFELAQEETDAMEAEVAAAREEDEG